MSMTSWLGSESVRTNQYPNGFGTAIPARCKCPRTLYSEIHDAKEALCPRLSTPDDDRAATGVRATCARVPLDPDASYLRPFRLSRGVHYLFTASINK